MKLEIQVLALLVFSVLMLGVYYIFPRSECIDLTGPAWHVEQNIIPYDRYVEHSFSERGVEVDFSLAERVEERKRTRQRSRIYYAFGITKTKQADSRTADFSWMETISLKAYLLGKEEEAFRMHVSNRVPGITDDALANSHMLNQVTFKLTNEPQTLNFRREHFQIPLQWIERHDLPLESSAPAFDASQMFKFIAIHDRKEADYKLVIEEIVVTGRWIPTAIMYRTLLLMWLVLAVGAAIEKTLELRRRTKSMLEREGQLTSINELLREQAEDLAYIAKVDSLTGLLNRHGLRDCVAEAMDLASELEVSVGLILLDIDHFKQINDTLGHNVGDEILADLGELLSTHAGESESVGRWGGEEFVVICEHSDIEQTRQRAENLRQFIENELNVTCSFGVTWLDPDQLFVSAIACADSALYLAKSLGRNRVEVYCPAESALPKKSCQKA